MSDTSLPPGPLGLFGGTFDPIHYGHLRTAFELQQALKLGEVRFMPTGNPPHRDQTLADAAQRLALVRAAVALRCENDLAQLFPEPAAASMDELLERQRQAAATKRQRGRRARL